MERIRIEQLGDPKQLTEVRLQVHWALQTLSAAADARLEHADDDSHSNLGYDGTLPGLAGRPLPGGSRLALRLTDGVLVETGATRDIVDQCPVHQQTLDGLFAWINECAAGEVPEVKPRDYDMPGHPVAQGVAFDFSDAEALQNLNAWCAFGDARLTDAIQGRGNATPVRLWPHHFDFGSLVVHSERVDSRNAASVGIGMSLGDHYYPQPYFYVNPYGLDGLPDTLPRLPANGFWTEHWTGAVLLGESVVEHGVSAPDAFLGQAIEDCFDLIDTH